MDPFVGEIRIFGFTFAPKGWAYCGGQTVSIRQYTALFSLLGTNYGGDGKTTFGLPNFNGNAPMHQGQGNGLSPYQVGQTSGTAQVTLTQPQMPMHSHGLFGGLVTPPKPAQNVPAPTTSSMVSLSTPVGAYSTQLTPVTMAPNAILPIGGGGPHDNMQPYLTLNFCIALQGIFPSRN